jgi:hypothetical protein
VIITRINNLEPGNIPSETALIESIAMLSGFNEAGMTSQPGIEEYGIMALDAKNKGIVIIAVTAA